LDSTPFDNVTNMNGSDEVRSVGWSLVIGDGRLVISSVLGGGIAISSVDGPLTSMVKIQAGDFAQLAFIMHHLAVTGQPPRLR